MSDTDPYVPCPRCDGRGGHTVQRGYTTTGWGYGDAHPTERTVECAQCDGTGKAHVRTLTDEQWSEL